MRTIEVRPSQANKEVAPTHQPEVGVDIQKLIDNAIDASLATCDNGNKTIIPAARLLLLDLFTQIAVTKPSLVLDCAKQQISLETLQIELEEILTQYYDKKDFQRVFIESYNVLRLITQFLPFFYSKTIDNIKRHQQALKQSSNENSTVPTAHAYLLAIQAKPPASSTDSTSSKKAA